MKPCFQKPSQWIISVNVLLMAFFLFSCSGKAQRKTQSKTYEIMLKTLLSNSVNPISVDSLQKLMNQQSIYLFDARPETEFKISRIPGAIQVGYESFSVDSISSDIPKEATIIVYCSVGYRSEKVGEQLADAGFKNVSNLFGGIFEWVNQGKPVETPVGIPTDSVHAYNKKWGIWLNKGIKVY